MSGKKQYFRTGFTIKQNSKHRKPSFCLVQKSFLDSSSRASVLDTRLQLLSGTQLQKQPCSKFYSWFLGRPTLAKRSTFNCLETCSYLSSFDSSSPQSMGQSPLYHHCRVSALHVTLRNLYHRKERSGISHLAQIQGHSLWEGLGLWAFLKILRSPMLVTNGCSSWETLNTQHKQFDCTESTCSCRKPDTMDMGSALSPSSPWVRVQI